MFFFSLLKNDAMKWPGKALKFVCILETENEPKQHNILILYRNIGTFGDYLNVATENSCIGIFPAKSLDERSLSNKNSETIIRVEQHTISSHSQHKLLSLKIKEYNCRFHAAHIRYNQENLRFFKLSRT